MSNPLTFNSDISDFTDDEELKRSRNYTLVKNPYELEMDGVYRLDELERICNVMRELQLKYG